MLNYKEIHLGNHIREISKIKNLSVSRACTFLKCSAQDIQDMYNEKSLDSALLLRWCKLLDYNFFMFYHSHLQLYKPSAATTHISKSEKKEEVSPYEFKKNLYSPELIDYILGKLDANMLSIRDVIQAYNIPRTTIYRWVKKRKRALEESHHQTEGLEVAKKKVNYKELYRDYLSETKSLPLSVKHDLKEKINDLNQSDLTYSRINKLNAIIKKYSSSEYKEVDYQHLKAYDKDQIIRILKEQKEFNLSNCELSLKYKMSRTTIARWRSLYEA